nr:unnamed protein product [Digitaria exilis]
MEAASSDQYRSSSSSASSPARRYYLPKPGALRRPISFEDSPDWDDIHLDDNIHLATAPSAAASISSSAYPSPSPSLQPGPSASGAAAASACRERKVAGATLVWKDLTVSSLSASTNRFSDRLVKSSNGYALPATLTVIMGPARSGKSTLLRAIAGRLTAAERMYGEVFVNGAKSRLPYGSYMIHG